jgi:hypothetical protein
MLSLLPLGQVSAMAGVPPGVRNVARRMGAALEQKLRHTGAGGAEAPPPRRAELEVTAAVLRALRPSPSGGGSLPQGPAEMQALVRLWREARDLAR